MVGIANNLMSKCVQKSLEKKESSLDSNQMYDPEDIGKIHGGKNDMTLKQFMDMLKGTRKDAKVKLDLYQSGKEKYSAPVPAFNKNRFVINNEDSENQFVINNEDSASGTDITESHLLNQMILRIVSTTRASRTIELKKKIWQTCLNRSQLCLILLKRLWTKYCKQD